MKAWTLRQPFGAFRGEIRMAKVKKSLAAQRFAE